MHLKHIPGTLLLACIAFTVFCTNANSATILRNAQSDWIENWCGSDIENDYPQNIYKADAWTKKCEAQITIEPEKSALDGSVIGCIATKIWPDVMHIVGKNYPTIRWTVSSGTGDSSNYYFDDSAGVSLVKSSLDFTKVYKNPDTGQDLSPQEFALQAKNAKFAAFQYDIKISTKIQKKPVECKIADPLVITHG